MHNLLPKLLALILVSAGFAATGDLARVMGLGLRLVNARTVPSEEQPAAPTAPSPPALPNPVSGSRTTPVSMPIPPAGGPDMLALDTLSPGDRLIVWLEAPTATSSRPWVAFDLIDPLRLEALVQGSFGSPRRVRLRVVGGRGSAAGLAKGLSLHTTPIGIAQDAMQADQAGETIGPVTAFTVTQAD